MTGRPKNRMLFKSFTGMKIMEFTDIYDMEVAKIQCRHEIRRLSNRKDGR